MLKRHTAHLLAVLVLSLLAYANTFNVPFQFDDTPNIVENPAIHNLASFTGDLSHKRYAGYMSFALNYRFHGLDVRGYHAVNLFIHMLNALLVYALVVMSFRTVSLKDTSMASSSHWLALFCGALFAVHPVQTQAVTYIVQRLASLAALFYLGSLAAYVTARLAKRSKMQIGFYLLALLSAVLAMKTKQNAFTLPLAVAMYECMFFRGGIRKRTILLLPVLLTMLIIPLTHLDLGKPVPEAMKELSYSATAQFIPRTDYLVTQIKVVATYLRLFVLPLNQSLDYDYPVSGSLADASVLVSMALHCAILGAGIYLMRKRSGWRLASFGVFFFYLALSVESVVVLLHPAFEHRVYLPAAGLVIAAGVAIFALVERLASRGARRAAYAAMAALLMVLLVLTVQRNTVWQSEVGLWEDVVSKAPNKMRGRLNLGREYGKKGMFEKARVQYEMVTRLKPGIYAHAAKDIAKAYAGLGTAYMYQGKIEEAVVNYNRAIQIKPDYAMAYYNLGIAYGNRGMHDEAIQKFRKAIALEPEMADAHFNLGVAYANKGSVDLAVEHARNALRIDPSHEEANRFMRKLGR
jgi:tetratricopeptide (TPR) repeat protein